MKIEWLDNELTQAIVYRGVFRKRAAYVRRITQEEWDKQSHRNWWRFVASDRVFPHNEWMERRRMLARHYGDERRDWLPVNELPRARALPPGGM